MTDQLPHDYQTCNCGACKMIRLELKREGHTLRPIPTGPVSERLTPPSKAPAKSKIKKQ